MHSRRFFPTPMKRSPLCLGLSTTSIRRTLVPSATLLRHSEVERSDHSWMRCPPPLQLTVGASSLPASLGLVLRLVQHRSHSFASCALQPATFAWPLSRPWAKLGRTLSQPYPSSPRFSETPIPTLPS